MGGVNGISPVDISSEQRRRCVQGGTRIDRGENGECKCVFG